MRTALTLMVCALSLGADVRESAELQKTFPIAQPGSARVEVDNVWGGIKVTGYDGREVQVTARQTFIADDNERLAAARREVKLDMTQQGDTVKLYVDGPFRCDCSEGRSGRRGDRHLGYRVRYDFEIRAPRESAVWLHTVTDGDIHVANIGGGYDIKNINGGIEFLDAGGSGRVYALNGGVKVTFRENPRAESSFGSLNGEVELYFQPDLSADLRMKTFNGNIYSDFPVVALPIQSAATAERRDGKFRYKSDRFGRGRVGNGGPEITLDGFNGDIRILKRQ